MDVEEVARAISWPADAWEGSCYGVADAMLDAGLAEGELRYGHWLGPVAPGTLFAGRPIIRHGWIERQDGSVIDPTRWVFEGKSPYIYEGPNDHYDAGGNVWRKQNERPPPERTYEEAEADLYEIELPEEVEEWLPGSPALKSWAQCMWLANLSLYTLGLFAEQVYEEIIRVGLGALIPFDNRNLVLPQPEADPVQEALEASGYAPGGQNEHGPRL